MNVFFLSSNRQIAQTHIHIHTHTQFIHQVYDPATDVWSTVGTIPEEYLASDNGAFTNAEQSEIYVVGGYNQNYYEPEALATTFSFNIRETFGKFLMENNNMMENFEQTIQVTKRANLNQQRGDMHAVASYDGTTAYVAGGYASYPCQPLTVRRTVLYILLDYRCYLFFVLFFRCVRVLRPNSQ